MTNPTSASKLKNGFSDMDATSDDTTFRRTQTPVRDAPHPLTYDVWCEVFGVQLLSELEMFSLQKL